MGDGRWTRWGRGSCEGWSLELGTVFRGSVTRRDQGLGKQPLWGAAINGKPLSESLYPDRNSAVRAVEQSLESSMRALLEHWTLYQAQKMLGRRAARR